MIRRPPRSTRKESSAASDVYKRQHPHTHTRTHTWTHTHTHTQEHSDTKTEHISNTFTFYTLLKHYFFVYSPFVLFTSKYFISNLLFSFLGEKTLPNMPFLCITNHRANFYLCIAYYSFETTNYIQLVFQIKTNAII